MTARHGVWKAIIEIDHPRVFHFPQGMMGFPHARNYIILDPRGGDIACLQATECIEAAFLVTPWDKARLEWVPELTGEQRACLQYTPDCDLQWLLVLNPFTNPDWVLANTRAPIVINLNTRLGIQAIQVDESLDMHYQWMPQPGTAQQVA